MRLSLRAASPAAAFPNMKAASSRAGGVFLNFPVLHQASYKGGYRKALHNYCLTFTYSVFHTLLRLFYSIGVCVKTKHIDATKFVKIWILG